MANLRLSLFLLPLWSRFCLSYGSSLDDTCSLSTCRAGGLLVKFPFRLVDKQIESCGYPGFDLSCDDQGRTVMNLTESGEFIVYFINYRQQIIHLIDPNGCTPRRLATFSTLGSAFRIESYRNITLLKCPPYFALGYSRVPCLSDNFNWVVIGPMEKQLAEIEGCWEYMTMATPVVHGDYLLLSNPLETIVLRWDHPACGLCEDRAGRCRIKNKETQQITCAVASGHQDYTILFTVMTLLLIILTVICCYILRRRHARATNSRPSQDSVLTFTATAQQPPPRMGRNRTGMDSPALASYPKIKISEKMPSQLRGSGDDESCAICLLDYCPSDTVKIIPECEHYFHEDCLDRWLRTKATCPLCRNQQLRSTDPGTE